MKLRGLIILLLFIATDLAWGSTGRKDIRLRLQEGISGYLDETTVYFDLGTSTAFSTSEDIQKSFDSTQIKPQLYSFSSDNVACFSNGFGNFTATTIVEVGLRITGTGNYVFSLPAQTNFDPATNILLEDRQTGTFTDLRANNYTFQTYQATQGGGRFYLHVTYPPQINITAAGCSHNDGAITITQDSSIIWTTIRLYDSSMVLLTTYNNVGGDLGFGNLAEGSYNVMFVYGPHTTVTPVVVIGHQIKVSISASMVLAAVNQDIAFFSSAMNATRYDWDFGDGTLIGGVANPDYFYSETGTYNVSLICTNTFGCSASDSLSVTIVEATGIAAIKNDFATVAMLDKTLKISLLQPGNENYRFEVYDMAGSVVTSGTITSFEYLRDLSAFAPGIYIVRITSGRQNFSQKIYLPQ